MNEYEEFLNGIAALAASAFAVGMLAHAIRTAYRDRQRMSACTGDTAAPLATAQTASHPTIPTGGAPEAYKRYRLLITGCRDPLMWYANKVGQEVPYLGTWPSEGCHKSREDAGYINIVKLADATVVIREERTK